MERSEWEGYAAGRGYRCVGGVTVGVYNGYPFQGTLRTGKIDVMTVVFRVAKAPKGNLVRGVKKELPQGGGLVADTDRVTLTCSGREGDLIRNFESSMRVVTDMLREASVSVPDVCPLCRKKDCDALALVNGYVPVHRACCQQGAYDTVTKAELNQIQGSYVTGLVGALLGAFVGSIPSILTIWFLERIWALLYALIPLCAYWGYKLLRGKRTQGSVVLVIIASVLALFAMEQVYFYMLIVDNWGIWPSIFATIPFYFELMSPGEIASDMAMSFLFLALGIWIVSRQINTTSQDEVADASLRMESLQSWRSNERSTPEL